MPDNAQESFIFITRTIFPGLVGALSPTIFDCRILVAVRRDFIRRLFLSAGIGGHLVELSALNLPFAGFSAPRGLSEIPRQLLMIMVKVGDCTGAVESLENFARTAR